MDTKKKRNFSIAARAKSATHAFRGVYVVFKTQTNIVLGAVLSLFGILLGFLFSINATEWCLLLFAIGLGMSLEMINTAIEIDIDLTSPEYHPFARDTKDVAAGAVLIAALVSLSICCIIFIPKILALFK